MLDLLRLLPVRNVCSRPLRSLLTAVGIASGVALFAAIEIINASTLGFFSEGVRAMAGESVLSVSGSEAGFSQEQLDVIRSVAGVRYAVPLVQSIGYLPGNGKDSAEFMIVLGVAPRLEPLVRSYRSFDAASDAQALLALERANTVLLTESYAKSHGLTLGASIERITQRGRQKLTLAGTISPTGAAKAYGGNVAVVDLETAQKLFGMTGKLTRVDIVAEPGGDIDALAAAIDAALGPGYNVQSTRARVNDMHRMVEAYQRLLTFFSAMAVLAGIMVLAATINIAVAEQQRNIGVLRALGATRRTILWMVEAEAAAIGAAGAILGVAGGRFLAELLVDFVSRSMSHQYMMPIAPTTLHYPFGMALVHGACAMLLASGAACVAAYRAASIEPIDAIRPLDIQADARFPRWPIWSTGVGLCLLIYLAAVLTTRIDRELPALQTANAGLGLLAAVLVAPGLVLLSLSLARRSRPGRSLVDRAPLLRLALGSLLRMPARTGWNALVLSIGLLMFVTAVTLHHSLQTSIENWLDRILFSDLLVASPGRLFLSEVQPLHESVGRQIDSIPGVDVVEGRGAMGIRYVTLPFENHEIVVKAFDRPRAAAGRLPFDLRTAYPVRYGGNVFDTERPTALVSENFAKHFKKRPGDTLNLDSPSGPIAFEIIGIVTDYASPEGVVYLSRDLYKARWMDPLVSFFAVSVKPQVAVSEVYDNINQTLGAMNGIYATNNRELREQMREILAESFSYTYAIEGAALLVGLLGIMSSMVTTVLVRARELAMLRTLGMSRNALRAMVVTEAVCQTIPTSIIAVALGFFLAYLGLHGILSAVLGWTLEFHVSALTFFATIAIGLTTGACASALAAYQSARPSIGEALSGS